MKKLVSVLCMMALTAMFVFLNTVTAYSTEDESITNPGQYSNNNRYYYDIFYSTLKKPSDPAIYNDWIFANDTSGGNVSWYNEKEYFYIMNTSDKEATAYVYLYKTNGKLYNNNGSGIEITIPIKSYYGLELQNFYDDISDNWGGDTPLEGFIKVIVPITSNNGTVQPCINHVIFEGNKGCTPSNPFDKYAHLTTYMLKLAQLSDKDFVNDPAGLISFPMYINKWYNGNDELDVTGEVVNFLKIANASEGPASIKVTYYDGFGGTTSIGSDTFDNISGHGSISYCPTAQGYGLYSSAMSWVNTAPASSIFTYNAVVAVPENEPGNPVAITGHAVELRRNSGDIYDSLSINMPHLTK